MVQSFYTQPIAANGLAMTNHVAVIRADVLRSAFHSVVSEVGGKPDQLMISEGINPELLREPDGLLPFRSMINLLERSARELGVADFGLLLARHTIDATKTTGPLEFASKNAGTLREAFMYCARQVHVFCSAIHISLERSEWDGREYMLFDVLLDGVPYIRQVVEHSLGLTCNSIKVISNRRTFASEVWFSHGEPPSTASYSRAFSGTPVRFNMPFNAVFFGKGDLDLPLENRDPVRFRMATDFIAQRYSVTEASLTLQVRIAVAKQLSSGCCCQTTVANLLDVHPRTLQRRLRTEGVTFEKIVDIVRREIALRSLTDKNVTLTNITEKLGYSETSVLTRSCQRWFLQSPIQMRKKSNAEHPD